MSDLLLSLNLLIPQSIPIYPLSATFLKVAFFLVAILGDKAPMTQIYLAVLDLAKFQNIAEEEMFDQQQWVLVEIC